MERSAYTLLHAMEKSWWYGGRERAVLAARKHLGLGKTEHALDYGAGYGGMYSLLKNVAEIVDAFEPDEEARAVAGERGYGHVFSTEEEAFKNSYDVVGVFDVLEHIENDAFFLEQSHGALTENGQVLITVPAFQKLWSIHDVEHHHVRRYSKKTLTKVLVKSGYRVEYISYWNASLLLPAAVMRFFGNSGGNGLTPASWLNTLLLWIVTVEAFVLSFVPLPFGLSLVAVAIKDEGTIQATTLTDRFWFLVRYGISGVVGGIIQVSFLYVWISVLKLESLYLAGVVLGFLIALVATFLLQKYWTFRNRADSTTRKQFLTYTAVALLGLFLNAVLLSATKYVFEYAGVNFFDMWYLFAQGGIVVIVSAVNFGLNTLVTFKKNDKKPVLS